MAADEFELDPAHTYPHFSIAHLDFSVMHGRFNESRGTVVMDREGNRSSVRVTVKAASVDTGHDKRDEYLQGSQFLDAARFSEIIFQSTRVEYTGPSTAQVQGSLTLRGVTRPLTLEVTRMVCETHPIKRTYACGFSARGTLRRSDFGMTAYLSMVGDKVDIRIEAEGDRKQQKAGPK